MASRRCASLSEDLFAAKFGQLGAWGPLGLRTAKSPCPIYWIFLLPASTGSRRIPLPIRTSVSDHYCSGALRRHADAQCSFERRRFARNPRLQSLVNPGRRRRARRHLQRPSLPRHGSPDAPRTDRGRAARRSTPTSSRCRKSSGRPHAGHAEEIGAALGMGWVMAPARQLRGHQFGNAVLSRCPITSTREHDLSWKTCEAAAPAARRHRRRRPHAARLQRPPRHRHPRAPASGAAAGDDRLGPARQRTEDRAGRFQRVDARARDDAAQREAEERRPARLPQAAAHLPGLFPLLHLDHIYYAGRVEISASRCRDAAVAGRVGSPAARRGHPCGPARLTLAPVQLGGSLCSCEALASGFRSGIECKSLMA